MLLPLALSRELYSKRRAREREKHGESVISNRENIVEITAGRFDRRRPVLGFKEKQETERPVAG